MNILKILRRNRLSLLASVVIVTNAGASLVAATVSNEYNIECNVVYDCGDGKGRFKVSSYTGPDKYDRCETSNTNALWLDGGSKG